MGEKSQRFSGDVRAVTGTAEYSNRQETCRRISLLRAPYGLAEQIGYMLRSKHG